MDRTEAEKRLKKLRNEINHHRYLYHVLNRQEISDAALDSLKHELTLIEEEFPDFITPDSPSQRVAGRPLPGFKKMRHAVPLLSLNDVFSEEELAAWEKRILKLLPTSSCEYFAEIKVDGFAISLVYENGILHTGSTRGTGLVGEDVTENLKTIESIPLRIHSGNEIPRSHGIEKIFKKFPRVKKACSSVPRSLEVRGEVYMTKKAFDEVNAEQKKRGLPLFANPRNIAAGSVRQLNPVVTVSRHLDFLAYDVITDLGQKTHEEDHLIAKLMGFKTVGFAERCPRLADVITFWKQMLLRREKLPLLIDGVVVQVNDSEIFERIGTVGKTPRGAVAFKFPAEEATTTVEDIIVQIGRTGVLTPVAVLKPVSIAGVTVSRATLHNIDEIERLGVRVGDTVIVRRAGDVIPDIIRMLTNLRPRGSKKFVMPRTFCGQEVVRKEGEVAHRILHPEQCELARRENFYHFVSKNAFDIQGLGPKIVDRLLEEGLITDPADIFALKEKDIEHLERFAEKSAGNLIRAVQSKKHIDFPRFIIALGIPHVGEETAIDLARQFGRLEKLIEAKKEDLIGLRDIGPVVAESISRWFQKKHNEELVKKLFAVGVSVKPYRQQATGYALRDKTFVLTGGLKTMTRDEAKTRIRKLGGGISETVSKKTSYVIAGSDAGSKLEKAKEMGVKIIDEEEFSKLISNNHS